MTVDGLACGPLQEQIYEVLVIVGLGLDVIDYALVLSAGVSADACSNWALL